jgi:hypothetical protein
LADRVVAYMTRDGRRTFNGGFSAFQEGGWGVWVE